MTVTPEYEHWLFMNRAIEARHSVRQYKDMPLSDAQKRLLKDLISGCNAEGQLHMQLITDEPKAFKSLLSKVMHFKNVTNYIALVGSAADSALEEKCGYYGERIVLNAQNMGMSTCWVGATYKRIPNTIAVDESERLVLLIAIGYAANPGKPHKSKTLESFCRFETTAEGGVQSLSEAPAWFQMGVRAAALAPTAVNQQKFFFTLNGSEVRAETEKGTFSNVDLGIAKLHFEEGAGKAAPWHWA